MEVVEIGWEAMEDVNFLNNCQHQRERNARIEKYLIFQG